MTQFPVTADVQGCGQITDIGRGEGGGWGLKLKLVVPGR